jgi:hypothetical protein
MTTVKEFKEWLNQFDDDTIITIHDNEEFKLGSKEDIAFGKCDRFTSEDFRNNQYTKEDSWWHGKQILNIERNENN